MFGRLSHGIGIRWENSQHTDTFIRRDGKVQQDSSIFQKLFMDLPVGLWDSHHWISTVEGSVCVQQPE